MSTNSRLYLHVFHKADAVNYYNFVLKHLVRELVAQHVRIMSESDKVNFTAVKQAAIAIGKSQRALNKSEKKKEGSNRVHSQKGTRRPVQSGKVMMVTPPWYIKGRGEEEAAAEWKAPSVNRDFLVSHSRR